MSAQNSFLVWQAEEVGKEAGQKEVVGKDAGRKEATDRSKLPRNPIVNWWSNETETFFSQCLCIYFQSVAREFADIASFFPRTSWARGSAADFIRSGCFRLAYHGQWFWVALLFTPYPWSSIAFLDLSMLCTASWCGRPATRIIYYRYIPWSAPPFWFRPSIAQFLPE